PAIKVLRGMYYVHLYAAMERVVNETVEQAILLIKDQAVLNKHYKTEFNAVSLYSRMLGFKAAGYKDFFSKSVEVFGSVDAEEAFDLNNTMFSSNLQNVWHETIQQTLKCFGISKLCLESRVRFTVDEIVDKRNAVAHGRESPITVGERHRCDVLRQKTQEIQGVVDLFVDAFETHITNKLYIKDHYRPNYSNALPA
ncbi:MAG: MAE_28990/MAE_18760 family HEPN-like nuclease, partial [Sulfuricurvum sp.]|nr:MAE_28990/MAE_18760 family HEPN-like nuclease [Sulfuricurvum sp.]